MIYQTIIQDHTAKHRDRTRSLEQTKNISTEVEQRSESDSREAKIDSKWQIRWIMIDFVWALWDAGPGTSVPWLSLPYVKRILKLWNIS